MAKYLQLSVCIAVLLSCLSMVFSMPQGFNFIQRRSPFRTFRSFSRPSWRRRSFRRSFSHDDSDEDFDHSSGFRNFGSFGNTRSFQSRGFGRPRFSNPFSIRRNRIFDDDDSFEHDD